MDENLYKYLELTKDNSIVLKDKKYAEIHLANDLFENNIAIISGDSVSTFAFLDIYIWDAIMDEYILNEATKISFRMPNVITTRPNRINQDNKNDITILEYHGGDPIVTTTMIPKRVVVVRNFFELLIKGKIPDDIAYNHISTYFEECARINGFNMGVNSLFVDLIVSAVARDPDNMSRYFREALADNPKTSMLSRKLVNMEVIPTLTSQFSAISGSNPKYGITSSIGAVRSGDLEPEESDIEQAIQ